MSEEMSFAHKISLETFHMIRAAPNQVVIVLNSMVYTLRKDQPLRIV